MIDAIFKIICRECLSTWRRPWEWLTPILFFILVVLLFPLSLSPDPKLLRMIGPGIVWVAALLSILLSLNRLFQEDYEDGSLEQWIMGPQAFPLLIFIKILSHWLLVYIPLALILPILALMFHLPFQMLAILAISLLIGTPLLTLLGAVGAALLVSLRQSGLLLALILLPLYIPTLIFASSALNAVASGYSPLPSLLWLGALLSLSLVLSPWICALLLRMAIAYR
jgi:heme exporter protein B